MRMISNVALVAASFVEPKRRRPIRAHTVKRQTVFYQTRRPLNLQLVVAFSANGRTDGAVEQIRVYIDRRPIMSVVEQTEHALVIVERIRVIGFRRFIGRGNRRRRSTATEPLKF